MDRGTRGGTPPVRGRFGALLLAFAVGWVGCGNGTQSLSSSLTRAEPRQQALGVIEEAAPKAPPKRLRAMPGRGALADFADLERPRKIKALVEQQRLELEAELRALAAPGFAWGVVVDGELVAAGADGTTRIDHGSPATTSTLFRVGSITKVFTALALLQLRDRGQIALDRPLREWLPEFDGVVYPSADSPLITPRHLLLHRSGLPRLGAFDYTVVDKPPTEREVLGALEGVELHDAPGMSFEYSNFGYALLGVLVARAARQPFDAYVTEHILQPLAMSHSVWTTEGLTESSLARPHAERPDGTFGVVPEWPQAASDGAGGLYSSVEDLARFAAFQLAAWPASSAPEGPVLARSSLRESQGFQAVDRLRLRVQGDEPPRAQVTGEGLGWSVYRDCRFEQVSWHNGGTEGHRAVLYLLPAQGLGLIILANRDGVDLDGPARRFLARLHDASALPRREPVLVLSEAWRHQVHAALALGREFDRAKFESLFDAATREVLTPAIMQPFLEKVYQNHGRCESGSPAPSRHDHWQAVTLTCERGEPRMLEAALSPSQQLIGLWIGSPEHHAERVRQRTGAAEPCSH